MPTHGANAESPSLSSCFSSSYKTLPVKHFAGAPRSSMRFCKKRRNEEEEEDRNQKRNGQKKEDHLYYVTVRPRAPRVPLRSGRGALRAPVSSSSKLVVVFLRLLAATKS